MEPLRELTCKDVVWHRAAENQQAFECIKAVLTTSLTLTYFDSRKNTTLQCDASQYGLGVVILQDDQPVEFAMHS